MLRFCLKEWDMLEQAEGRMCNANADVAVWSIIALVPSSSTDHPMSLAQQLLLGQTRPLFRSLDQVAVNFRWC